MKYDFETRCIHGDPTHSLGEETCAISFPIYQTASFSHIKPGHNASGFDYTRESNPTRQRLEEIVSSLEGAAGASAFSSGMAAITACFELFRPGDHIICSEDLYGGVIRLHDQISVKNGLCIDYINTTDPQAIKDAIRPDTKAIYIETPSNPIPGLGRGPQFRYNTFAAILTYNRFPPLHARLPPEASSLGTAGSKWRL